MPRYLILFEKGEPVRWLSHLDILRAFERAIRRSQLPIAFSSGFNPRERLVFASALSTGVTGAAEPAMLELTGEVLPQEVADRLNSVLPPGLQIHHCSGVPDAQARAALPALSAAEYVVLCDYEGAPESVDDAARWLLGQAELIVLRERDGKQKRLDIRPHLLSLSHLQAGHDRIELNMTLLLGSTGSARPADVVASMSDRLPGVRIRRVHRARLYNPEEQHGR